MFAADAISSSRVATVPMNMQAFGNSQFHGPRAQPVEITF